MMTGWLTIFRTVALAMLVAGFVPRVMAQPHGLEAFRQQALSTHNALRERHGAAPLVLDAELNDIAQDWAQRLASTGAMQHRPNNRFGENIFVAWGSQRPFDVNGVRPVQWWYDEVKLYDFNNPGFSMQTGHFTQVVWKTSTRLGCGKAQAADGKVFIVCNYDPPGNFQGRFPQNVDPARALQGRPPQAVDSARLPARPPSGDLTVFRQEALSHHNALRERHGAAPLILDSDLNDLAQDWAQQLARTGNMQHRPNSKAGENIFMAWGSQRQFDVNGVRPVQSWYDEVKLYDFNNPGFSMQTGHFTQVVWKTSARLGCGKAQAADGKVFIVCNYDPPGNFQGRFPQNVDPAR